MAIGNTQRTQFARPTPFAPQPQGEGRGVYECEQDVEGVRPYYNRTSTNAVLSTLRPRPHETTAEIIVMLADELDREDPALRIIR